MKLTVASLNVNGAEGAGEFLASGRAAAIVEAIAEFDVDLVALQEFPFLDPAPSSPSVSLFGGTLGLPHHELFGLIGAGGRDGGHIGLATFARHELGRARRVEFPAPPEAVDVAVQGDHTPDLHPKGALACRVKDAGTDVAVVNLHGIPFRRFGIEEHDTILEYWRTAGVLLDRAGFVPPLMILGDFNAGDRSGLDHAFDVGLSDLFVGTSTRRDGRQTDSMLVAELKATDVEVVGMAPHSDHEMLIATVETTGL